MGVMLSRGGSGLHEGGRGLLEGGGGLREGGAGLREEGGGLHAKSPNLNNANQGRFAFENYSICDIKHNSCCGTHTYL